MSVKISLKTLLETGAHFGHQSRRWNPKMEEFVHGVQDGVHVFDLIKTKEALEEALSAITQAVIDGKTILLLGTKKQAKEKIAEIAKEVEIPYVNERWLGGTLTNFDQIEKSVKKLADMKAKKEAGELKKFTKKERVLLDREIDRLERFFGGISEIKATPEMLFVVDIKREVAAIKEAKMAGVELVGIVDSNSDPYMVDYPIPMNDDAVKAIEYILELVKEAIMEGKKKILKKKVVKEDEA